MLLEFKMPQVDQVAWVNPDQVCAVMTNEQMTGRSLKSGCVVLLNGGHKISLAVSAAEASEQIGAAREQA